jgi:hypothetical protein
MTWKIWAILPVLASMTPMQRLGVYLVEEASVVLGVVATMLIIALLFAVVLVLFSEMARFGSLWLKAKLARFVGLGHDQSAHREATVDPLTRRG